MKKAVAIFVVCCFVAAFADNPHITMLRELIDVALSSPADGDVLTFNASTGKWNNKANTQPVFPDTAKVVLRYQQENVVGIFPETTLFTPEETSLYRVSIYASGDGLSGGGVAIRANDGAVTSAIFARGESGQFGSFWGEHTGTIRAIGGYPVTITSGSSQSTPYSFYVVVEKM